MTSVEKSNKTINVNIRCEMLVIRRLEPKSHPYESIPG